MLHRIDGVLAAIGMFEITPETFNSTQFAYDPQFKFLNMGTFGALMELQLMAKLR